MTGMMSPIPIASITTVITIKKMGSLGVKAVPYRF